MKKTVEITVEDSKFLPKISGEGIELNVRIPPDINGHKKCNVVYRNVYKIDCGFSMKVPEGHKILVEPEESLSSKGIFINPSFSGQKLFLNVTSVGKEIIPLSDGDLVGKLYLVPIQSIKVKSNVT